MNVYKKVFHYVPEKIVPGILSILTSLLSGVILVYAYMLLYFFLENLILFRDEGQSYAMSLKIVLALTLAGLCYLFSGVLSHIFAFRLATNLRKKGIEGLASASFRFYDLHSSGYLRKTLLPTENDGRQPIYELVSGILKPSQCRNRGIRSGYSGRKALRKPPAKLQSHERSH